jgi:hypothetical protein
MPNDRVYEDRVTRRKKLDRNKSNEQELGNQNNYPNRINVHKTLDHKKDSILELFYRSEEYKNNENNEN